MNSQQLPLRVKGVEIETISRIMCLNDDYVDWSLLIVAVRRKVISKSFWLCSVDIRLNATLNYLSLILCLLA